MNTRKMFCGFLTFGLFLFVATASSHAVSLSVVPNPPSIEVGNPIDVDIVVSDLGNSSAPSLGAYSFNLGFNDTILNVTNVAFGTNLGAPASSISSNIVGSGNVFFQELSIPPALFTLNLTQPGAFTLATVTFDTLTTGASDLTLSNIQLFDAIGGIIADPTVVGSSVQVTPEPTTFLLWGSGIVGLVAWRKIRRK